MSGDLGDYGIKVPTADDGIKVVFGLEYRKELLDYLPDNTAQQRFAVGIEQLISVRAQCD